MPLADGDVGQTGAGHRGRQPEEIDGEACLQSSLWEDHCGNCFRIIDIIAVYFLSLLSHRTTPRRRTLVTEPHVGYRGMTTKKIKPGELCANCAKKIVPHINRDGMPIHYFTIRESAPAPKSAGTAPNHEVHDETHRSPRQNMLVADLHHFLDLPADTPGPARRLGEHLSNIVAAATAGDAHTAWESALPCRRRPPTAAAQAGSSCSAPRQTHRSAGNAAAAATTAPSATGQTLLSICAANSWPWPNPSTRSSLTLRSPRRFAPFSISRHRLPESSIRHPSTQQQSSSRPHRHRTR